MKRYCGNVGCTWRNEDGSCDFISGERICCCSGYIGPQEEEPTAENPEKPLLIFRANITGCCNTEITTQIRNDIIEQIEDGGVVVLPPYVDLLYASLSDYEVQVVDADGKE